MAKRVEMEILDQVQEAGLVQRWVQHPVQLQERILVEAPFPDRVQGNTLGLDFVLEESGWQWYFW